MTKKLGIMFLLLMQISSNASAVQCFIDASVWAQGTSNLTESQSRQSHALILQPVVEVRPDEFDGSRLTWTGWVGVGNYWGGTVESGRLVIDPYTGSGNRGFQSIQIGVIEDFYFETKVDLGGPSTTSGGIGISSSSENVILFRYGSLVTFASPVSSANSLLVGTTSVTLRLEKNGSIIFAKIKENPGDPWTVVGSYEGLTRTASFFIGVPSQTSGDRPPVYFDYLRAGPYAPTGTWMSAPIDLSGTPSTKGQISWMQDLPGGARIDIQTSTSPDSVNWSPWSAVYSDNFGSWISSPNNRYIRALVTMHPDASGEQTPALSSVTIDYPDTAPGAPLLKSLSHPVGTWSRFSRLELDWTIPTDSPAPVSAYSYWLKVDGALTLTASVAIPLASAGKTQRLSLQLPQQGAYTLDLTTRGDDFSGGLSASAQTYAFLYDGSAPSETHISSPTHPQLIFANNRNPVFELSATDPISGVAGYAVALDKAPLGDPGVLPKSGSTYKPGAVDNGTWYLHARAIDAAGNTGAVSHYGIRVDYNGDLVTAEHVKALPNPVSGDEAVLEYELAAPAVEVSLELLAPDGSSLRSEPGPKDVGRNQVRWDVRPLANGVYFFRVKARSAEDGRTYSVIKKVAVLR